MQAHYVAIHHTIKTNVQIMATFIEKLCKYAIPKSKNKRIENVTFPKSVAIEPELCYKITLMYKCCCYIEQMNVQSTTVRETMKLKQ